MLIALINFTVKFIFDIVIMVAILYGVACMCLGPEVYEMIQGVI